MLVGIGVGVGLSGKARKVLVRDSFNRADNAATMGNADTGQAWSTYAGTFGISSNQAYIATHVGADRAVINAGASDCAANVVFATVTQAQRFIFRNSDINNEWFIEGLTSSYTINKRVAGTPTIQASYPVGVQSNDQIKVTCKGSVITLYLNGVSVLTVTDSFNSTATFVGIGKSTVSACTWDKLVVEAI